MTKFSSRRRGFTLIELLIVIVVIAILALIVIPKLLGAGRQAKEATLKANLQRLRSAVSQFQADTGYYPKALTDLSAAAGSVMAVDSAGADLAGSNLAAMRASYKGPYLDTKGGIVAATGATGIPQNPFTAAADLATVTKHWTYTNTTGTVVSGVSGSTVDGTDFANL